MMPHIELYQRNALQESKVRVSRDQNLVQGDSMMDVLLLYALLLCC